MATFEAQVEALTSLSVAGGTAPNQTELTQEACLRLFESYRLT